MIFVFGWPDPNTGFDQSEHALYTCYFIKVYVNAGNFQNKYSRWRLYRVQFISAAIDVGKIVLKILKPSIRAIAR